MELIPFLRQFRIGPFAIFDFVASYIGVYLLSPSLIKLFNKLGIKTTKAVWLWLTLPISVLVHVLVSNYTPLTKMVLTTQGDLIPKLIVLVMLFMGLKDVKKIRS